MKKTITKLCISSGISLALFAILGGALYFSLKKGVGFEHCSFRGITVSGFHLKLEKKLNLDIDAIVLSGTKPVGKKKLTLSRVRKAITCADFAGKWFDAIQIKKITTQTTTASLSYRGQGEGALIIDDPSYSLDTDMALSGESLNFDIRKFESIDYHSRMTGKVQVDLKRNTASADIDLDLAGTLPLQIHCEADRHALKFAGSGKEIIRDIRPVVELFSLGPDIQPWITDYLKGSAFQLHTIQGTIPYKTPATVFDTLYAKATVKDTEYSFAQKLPPIKSPVTDVVFENGILKIYPQTPTYAGLDGGKSWLDINFNPHEPILTAYIKTQAPVGDAIVTLLDDYRIYLPFKQTKGVTDGDLTLKINLEREDVEADGLFKVAAGTFEYDKHAYQVQDSEISLHNDDISIRQVTVGLQDILRMKAVGAMKIASRKADVHISVEKVDLPLDNTRLTLDTTGQPVSLEYRWKPDGEMLTASASAWKVGGVSVKADGFSAPFKALDFSLKLPATRIEVLPTTRFLLSGDCNLEKQEFNLVADLQSWESEGLKLDQARFPVTVVFGKGLDIASTTESGWLLKGKAVRLAPFKLRYADKNLSIGQAGLAMSGANASLSGGFDLASGRGSFVLDRLEIGNTSTDSFDFSGRNLKVELKKNDDSLTLSAPELGVSYTRKQASGWQFHVEDFGKLYDQSAFMQKYRLNKGAVDIWGPADTPPYLFSGKISSAYDFLVKDNIPVSDYTLKGEYGSNGWVVTINNDLQIQNTDRIRITSNDIGINISAFQSYMADHPRDKDDKTPRKIPDMDVQANNGTIYLNPLQNAPADIIRIHSNDGQLTGQLRYRKGKAEVEMNSTDFTLVGQGFDEKFMDMILKDSKFIGGKLSFYVSGLWEKFKGVIKIEDSVLKEGAVLNNILTFINTVPDLITFSLPEYSLQGLPFNQLYAGFNYDNDVINVNPVSIESNTMDMTGAGLINLSDNTIEMNIDLIRKTKQNIGKIPLLGYILVGDEKQPSITLNIKGDLDSPEISTSAYKDIVKTPFNILLRTISLPSRLLQQIDEAASDKGAVPSRPESESKK
jgi:hypothetical protein